MDDKELSAHLTMLVQTSDATFAMLLDKGQELTVRLLAQQLLAIIRTSLQEIGYNPDEWAHFKVSEN